MMQLECFVTENGSIILMQDDSHSEESVLITVDQVDAVRDWLADAKAEAIQVLKDRTDKSELPNY